MKQTMIDVFRMMCRYAVKDALIYCGGVLSAKDIVKGLVLFEGKNLSSDKVRKALRELAEEGLVKKTSYAVTSEDEKHPPINGWALTDAAFQTDIYHEEKKRKENTA